MKKTEQQFRSFRCFLFILCFILFAGTAQAIPLHYSLAGEVYVPEDYAVTGELTPITGRMSLESEGYWVPEFGLHGYVRFDIYRLSLSFGPREVVHNGVGSFDYMATQTVDGAIGLHGDRNAFLGPYYFSYIWNGVSTDETFTFNNNLEFFTEEFVLHPGGNNQPVEFSWLNGYLMPDPIPEPATLLLLGFGVAGVVVLQRRRQNA